ncbi:MAG: 30S ribosomal protein S8 [Candidatus Muproteobacteria bacterium RBG_16_64_10]|uniref:Small ribosomal subunit protein uS8 n=1 Tax=Candidatus Muproteobacteria bacterium RBG_16_64_10 TaxID=1817757 RepID=A0A1F6T7K3_9PROT|nr:MAG: 30S ribosomal protein S8 [Candidatus Muproteobacteria bacterium RBG_16_64_10]
MMTDPIADMLTRIRNGLQAEKLSVRMPSSRVKRAIAQVLKDEGYIEGFSESRESGRGMLEVALKYHEGRPVIDRIDRVSKPGMRVYRGRHALPRVDDGLGVVIVSTPQGVMSDRAARKAGLGGEVLCVVA